MILCDQSDRTLFAPLVPTAHSWLDREFVSNTQISLMRQRSCFGVFGPLLSVFKFLGLYGTKAVTSVVVARE